MKVNISKYYSSGQKIKIKIDSHDTYSMDYTLAQIILPMLIQLKNSKHGVPSNLVEVGGEDYVDQQSFDFYHESHKEAFDVAVKRWDEILDKMIWSFQQIVEGDFDKKYYHGNFDFGWEKDGTEFVDPLTGKKEYLAKLTDKNPKGHWHDTEGERLHIERIQEGINLFAKHYMSLWD